MVPYVLNWPGLPEIPVYIIDPQSKKLYTVDDPVPLNRLDLDISDNRYVRLSSVVRLFAPNIFQEMHWILADLQQQFNVKKVVHVTKSSSLPDDDRRKVTSYLPVTTLLALIMVWPTCTAFQAARKALLGFLDNYTETICTDCGYVQRDCRCDRSKLGSSDAASPSYGTYVGYGTRLAEKCIQTDPILSGGGGPGFGANAAASPVTGCMTGTSQGMTVFLPSGVKLQPGMKIPVSVSSYAAVGGPSPSSLFYPPMGVNLADVGSYGLMKGTQMTSATTILPTSTSLLLPQAGRSNKRGRPPVAPMPYLYQTSAGYQPSMAYFGSVPGVDVNTTTSVPSIFQLPAWQSILPPSDASKIGSNIGTMPPGVNYIRPLASTGASSSGGAASAVSSARAASPMVFHISQAGEVLQQVPTTSRKRKRSEGDAGIDGGSVLLRSVGMQTSTKSFVKKCKLKEGGGKPMDKTGTSPTMLRKSTSLLDDSRYPPRIGDVDGTADFDNNSEQSSFDHLIASPKLPATHVDVARFSKEERESVPKKFSGGKLWRQLDDDSDDDKPTGNAKCDGSGKSPEVVKIVAAVSMEGNGLPDASGMSSVAGNCEVLLSAGDVSSGNVPSKFGSFDGDRLDGTVAASDAASRDEPEKIKTESETKTKTESETKTETESETKTETESEAEGREAGADERTEKMSVDVESDVLACVERPSGETELPIAESNTSEEHDNLKIVTDKTAADNEKENETRDTSENKDEATVTNLAVATDTVDVTSTEVTPGPDKDVPIEVPQTNDEVAPPAPAPRKIYGKFEYMPTGEHIFRCLVSKCSQSFDTRAAAEMHNLVHPDGEALGHLQCPRCEFKAPFYHWFDLLRHMRSRHDLFMSRETFACKYCGLVFDGEDQLSAHIDFHYSNRYKCVHCGLLLLTWGQVKRHLEGCTDKHRGNVNLGCPYCTFVFHKKNIRNLHLLSHSDAGLACALCQDDANWSDWKTLRKHYQQKHAKILQGKIGPFRHKLPQKKKPPRCKRCDVEFKSTEVYVAHMLRAHDLVPYTLVECAQCGRKFRTERSHEWHVKHVHVEEVPCEKCDFVATSKSVLKLHITQKHSDKQHVCSECDKSFALYHQLRVHMAHHARRMIYPCQKCDQEFSRQADLKQHQIHDHTDPSDKAPQSCPECEYRCFSRATLNAHIKKNHPELLEDDNVTAAAAAGDGEDEEEGADHCYSHKKAEALSSLSSPPETIRQIRRGVIGRRRGRQKKTTKYEWDRVKKYDNYSAVEDRRERRRLKRLQKENDDRLKKLKKLTSARTRSYVEHQYMKNGGSRASAAERDRQLKERQLQLARVARTSGGEEPVADDFGATESISSGILGAQPYLDHSYFKLEPTGSQTDAGQRFRMTIGGSLSRDDDDISVVDTPDVSAFQECETQLLGIGGAPIRRRGRPPLNPSGGVVRPVVGAVADARRKFTTVLQSASSAVSASGMAATGSQSLRIMPRVQTEPPPGGDADESLENLSGEIIPDFELIADADLLRNFGGYNIIDELLGISTSHSGGGAASAFQSEGATRRGGSGMALRYPSFSSPHGDQMLVDVSAPLENNLPIDFEDIELGEDVYALFSGNQTPLGGAPTSSSGYGGEENGRVGGAGGGGANAAATNHDPGFSSHPPFPSLQSPAFAGVSLPSQRNLSPRRGGGAGGTVVSSARSASSGVFGGFAPRIVSATSGTSPLTFRLVTHSKNDAGALGTPGTSSSVNSNGNGNLLSGSGPVFTLPRQVKTNCDAPAPPARTENSGFRGASSLPNVTGVPRVALRTEPFLDTSGLLSLSEAANLQKQERCGSWSSSDKSSKTTTSDFFRSSAPSGSTSSSRAKENNRTENERSGINLDDDAGDDEGLNEDDHVQQQRTEVRSNALIGDHQAATDARQGTIVESGRDVTTSGDRDRVEHSKKIVKVTVVKSD